MSADLDKEIDRVAREMLDVDPPPGFNGRVLNRLDAPQRRFAWAWIVVPIAAAAVLLLSIVPPRSNGVIVPRQGPDYRLPAPVNAGTTVMAPVDTAPAPRPGAPSMRTVHAANVDEPLPLAEDPIVPPLAVPSPIALETVGQGKATPMTRLDVTPMDVPALEINALPETPHERLQE